MIHEKDSARNGCNDFSRFLQTAPRDLMNSGLFNDLAIAFVAGEEHRKVSCALLATAMGTDVHR
eukprot:257327-Prymnesium_polylepis.1